MMIKNIGNDINEFSVIDRNELDIPDEVSTVEAIIYNWVAEHYGNYEAMNPAWNIHMLAQEIEEQLDKPYKQKHTVAYSL